VATEAKAICEGDGGVGGEVMGASSVEAMMYDWWRRGKGM